jgi:long-chain acyl-CoA synthetase
MAINNLGDIMRTWGVQRPDAPAVHYEGRTITYGEFHERSNRLANALAASGVGVQDHVAFIEKNGPEFFELSFALGKLNAITVGVNWRLAPAEMAYIINDAQAKVLVVGPDFVPHIEKIEDELVGVNKVVVVGGGHARWDDYDEWLGAFPDEDPGAVAAPDDIATQLYTSGTTGLPKGVMLTNTNLFGLISRVAEKWGFTDTCVNLACMPMFHIAGSGWATVGFCSGAQTVLLRDVDPAKILELIPQFGVTNAFFVPAVIQFLLATPGVETTDFSTLGTIAYGASPITDAVLARAIEVFGCDIVQVYGLTETTGAITQLDAADHDPVHKPKLMRSCGKPYPWVEMRAVDPETAEDVPLGAVGELWTRSVQNMKGYWNNPAATAAAFTDDGWFKTGDAGYLDADGYVFLHDRVKDMIVSGGENIYPAEVENVLAKHPEVADVAVIGVPDDRWGEAVKAVVVRRDGSDVTEADIITFAREYLAGYKLPKSVDFSDVLPRNPSGKLLKRELREPYWEGRERRVN